MPLKSAKEVLNLKLGTLPVRELREMAAILGVPNQGRGCDIIKRLLASSVNEQQVDNFIKQKYTERIERRRAIVSDDSLKEELRKVETFSWGVVQGQLDQKIQREYVRRFYRYSDLTDNVKRCLHSDITHYVVCTWFNHWTTVLIEEHIGLHRRVVPTLKNINGIDIFFDGQPFDLKVTYLPRAYNIVDAIEHPRNLAVWMYENQGQQRFGADNRIFVILLDQDNPEKSWELKRHFELIFGKIDRFFDTESVSDADEVVFTYKRRTYTTITKVLLITK